MKLITLALLSLLAGSAVAGEGADALVCNAVGYTKDPEQFHDIPVREKTNIFLLGNNAVVFRDKVFVSVDPETVGLQGLATTYSLEEDSRILYIYQDEQGETNVGISHLEPDSDAGFTDKSVYARCWSMNRTDTSNAAAQSTSNTEDRRTLSPEDIQYLQSDISTQEGFPPGARQ